MSRHISDYAMLSDSHSAALVSLDGVVEWLCLPRFDSPSLFGRLLDEDAGHWSLRPRGVTSARRHYRGRSLVLETRLSATAGRGVLVEALAFGEGERGHSIGLGSPHVLVQPRIDALPRAFGRHGGCRVERTGSRHLGGAWRPTTLRLLEGNVLGGA